MASRSDFGEATTSMEVAKAFGKEICGKTVLITGMSPKSLGESMAFSIASQKPALLILASRTRSKMDAVATKITEAFPDVPLKAVSVDFSSQESVREAAKEVDKLVHKIHILINNAGLMVPEHRFTKEGIELQFGVNHIGPFLFTNLLMNKIRAAAREAIPGATRIVNVSSGAHTFSPLRFSDYNFTGSELKPEERPPSGSPGIIFKPGPVYGGFLSYGQSKTANILMSVYFTDHLSRQGILSYSVHPGTILTDISRHLSERDAKKVGTNGTFWKSQDQGSATMLVAAFDPALNSTWIHRKLLTQNAVVAKRAPVAEMKGIYLNDCQIAKAAAFATDSKKADRLWHLSEDLVGQRFDLCIQSRL